MKTTIKTIATGLAFTALLMTSCKKGDTGPEGPSGMNGTNGTDGTVPMTTDGFIKGTISGTRQDGTSFNEAFEYTKYFSAGESATLDSMGVANYDFVITRGTTTYDNNNAQVTINTTSKSSGSGTISLDYFAFTKSLGTHKKFEFMLTGNPTTTITGLSYNMSTGLYTGNFTFNLTGFQNSTGNTATISGSFEGTVTQLYHLVKNPVGEMSK